MNSRHLDRRRRFCRRSGETPVFRLCLSFLAIACPSVCHPNESAIALVCPCCHPELQRSPDTIAQLHEAKQSCTALPTTDVRKSHPWQHDLISLLHSSENSEGPRSPSSTHTARTFQPLNSTRCSPFTCQAPNPRKPAPDKHNRVAYQLPPSAILDTEHRKAPGRMSRGFSMNPITPLERRIYP
jgi:hypothetical protein